MIPGFYPNDRNPQPTHKITCKMSMFWVRLNTPGLKNKDAEFLGGEYSVVIPLPP